MEEKLKALQTENLKTFESMKEANEQLKKEIKEYGEASGETKAKLEKIDKKFDELQDEIAKIQRPSASEAKDSAEAERKGVFEKYLRKGASELTVEEKKMLEKKADTLIIGNDTLGGYLAQDKMANEIIKNIVEYSPIRQFARVTPLSANALVIPKRTGTPTAYWTAEAAAATQTNQTYGQERLQTHKMTADIRVSRENLMDSMFNLESEIISDASEQFGVLEGTAFVEGNGVEKPSGMFVDANVLANSVTVATEEANLADGLVDLYHTPKSMYAQNGTFVMNRTTLKIVRKLQDGNGRYFWLPGGGMEGAPYQTILGRPIAEAVDAPDIATNAYPILFGDIRRGYRIADRTQISVVRDEMTLSSYDVIKFVLHKRVAGKVVLPEALAVIKTTY